MGRDGGQTSLFFFFLFVSKTSIYFDLILKQLNARIILTQFGQNTLRVMADGGHLRVPNKYINK